MMMVVFYDDGEDGGGGSGVVEVARGGEWCRGSSRSGEWKHKESFWSSPENARRKSFPVAALQWPAVGEVAGEEGWRGRESINGVCV
ncbi:hypothetical protein Tco_0430501 [Tanacetum coccineum]